MHPPSRVPASGKEPETRIRARHERTPHRATACLPHSSSRLRVHFARGPQQSNRGRRIIRGAPRPSGLFHTPACRRSQARGHAPHALSVAGGDAADPSKSALETDPEIPFSALRFGARRRERPKPRGSARILTTAPSLLIPTRPLSSIRSPNRIRQGRPHSSADPNRPARSAPLSPASACLRGRVPGSRRAS